MSSPCHAAFLHYASQVAQAIGVKGERDVAQARTIGRLWLDAVAANRTTPAYLVERDGAWQPVSWDDAARTVEELANGLLSAGIRKGDVVSILGQTTIEWALLDFALALIGAIGAHVYPNSSANDAQFVVVHSEAVAAVCEDEAQRAKIEPLGLEHVWTFAALDGLRESGRAFASEHPDALRTAASSVSADDLFTYIYTSGTTGPPKACMIRHSNYYEMVAVVDRLEDFTIADDLLLLYLPLAHNFGRLMHLAGPYVGYTIAFLPDPLRTADALLAGAADGAAERAARVREGARRRPREVRRGDRSQATIVDWSLRVGRRVERRCDSAGRRSRRASRCSSGWPTSSSTRRCTTGSAGGCGSRSRAARRSPGRSRSSSTRSASRSSRATASPSARPRRPSTA